MPRLFCSGPLALTPPTQYRPWSLLLFLSISLRLSFSPSPSFYPPSCSSSLLCLHASPAFFMHDRYCSPWQTHFSIFVHWRPPLTCFFSSTSPPSSSPIFYFLPSLSFPLSREHEAGATAQQVGPQQGQCQRDWISLLSFSPVQKASLWPYLAEFFRHHVCWVTFVVLCYCMWLKR